MEVKNICLSFGEKAVLDRFSLSLPAGGMTAFTGPSGCGKTTLLRVLAGLEAPRSGTVDGPESPAFLFQEDRLLPWLTAGENLSCVLPRARRGETERWLDFAELSGEGDVMPAALSGGMARRLALARCCALGGDALLLDEPFAGVDPERRARIAGKLRALGTPVVLISHEPDVLALCDRVFSFSGPPLRLE